jgi:hypothetical protein
VHDFMMGDDPFDPHSIDTEIQTYKKR